MSRSGSQQTGAEHDGPRLRCDGDTQQGSRPRRALLQREEQAGDSKGQYERFHLAVDPGHEQRQRQTPVLPASQLGTIRCKEPDQPYEDDVGHYRIELADDDPRDSRPVDQRDVQLRRYTRAGGNS